MRSERSRIVVPAIIATVVVCFLLAVLAYLVMVFSGWYNDWRELRIYRAW